MSKSTAALYGGFVSSANVTFLTSTSISSADGVVRNVSIERLRSFCAMVASASAGSEEEQRVRIVALDRRSQAAEVRHHETRQEIPELRRLGPIRGRVIRDRLRPADFVDPDHQRLEIRVLGLRAKVEREEAQGEKRDERQARSSDTCSARARTRTARRTGASRSRGSWARFGDVAATVISSSNDDSERCDNARFRARQIRASIRPAALQARYRLRHRMDALPHREAVALSR